MGPSLESRRARGKRYRCARVCRAVSVRRRILPSGPFPQRVVLSLSRIPVRQNDSLARGCLQLATASATYPLLRGPGKSTSLAGRLRDRLGRGYTVRPLSRHICCQGSRRTGCRAPHSFSRPPLSEMSSTFAHILRNTSPVSSGATAGSYDHLAGLPRPTPCPLAALFLGGHPRLRVEEVVYTPGNRFRLQVRV